MAPMRPVPACPKCRRRHCDNPTHRYRGRGPVFKSWAEVNRRAQAVADWRAKFGDWCPGWGTEPHAATDLTADHIIPVAAGGPETGELSVLCRICNSRKRNLTTV